MSDGTTNSQIVDSVTTASMLVSGQSPSQAMGMLDTVMAETLGMAMHNAVMRQQASGTVNAAAVTAACARMLQVPTQFGPLPTPVPPSPPTPPGIQPIQPGRPTPPTPPSPNGVSEALARAKAAISVILNGVTAGSQEEAEAKQALATLNQETTPPAPPAPPAPPTPPAPPSPPPSI